MKPLKKYIKEKDKICIIYPNLDDKIIQFIRKEFPDLDVYVSATPVSADDYGFIYKIDQKHIYLWENKIKNEQI